MAANPLLERTRSENMPTLTGDAMIQRLQDHCDMLNRMGWAAASGRPYFVGTVNGKAQVDRRDRQD